MILKVKQSQISGRVSIPGSKSHTIRALFISLLANGKSIVRNPLISQDTLSAFKVCEAFGANIKKYEDRFEIEGVSGKPSVPDDIIDVGNSGTTLRFAVMTATLVEGCTVFTGDYQIRRRPIGQLVNAINNLKGEAFTVKNNGSAPLVIKKGVEGGVTDLDSITSQYLSSLLINLPLAKKDSEINVTRLNEVPYVEITLWWLDKHGIKYENENMKKFKIYGNQCYKNMDVVIPGDFSTATFFMVAAAISGGEFILDNLDITDPQGDKEVVNILEKMGCIVEKNEKYIKIKGDKLKGMDIDMNSIPDALPAMAVLGCFAEGETKLLNVPQARLKETDRINVMCTELKKMGANIEELEDGLIIRKSSLKGAILKGHDDHRVVMSLTIAALNANGDSTIDTAESAKVTFPEFIDNIINCGGLLELLEE